MNASVKTRVFAFLIDALFVGVMFSIFGLFFSHATTSLEMSQEKLNKQYLNHEISFESYYQEYSTLVYQIDQHKKFDILSNLIIQIVYFVLLPFLWGGKTIGLWICKARIVTVNHTNSSLWSLLVRSIIVYGTGYLVFHFLLLYLLCDLSYFIGITILGFLQILLVISSGFMILYRKDSLGLQDIFSKTRVMIN